MGLSVWRETSKKLTVYRVCYTPIETLYCTLPEPLLVHFNRIVVVVVNKNNSIVSILLKREFITYLSTMSMVIVLLKWNPNKGNAE